MMRRFLAMFQSPESDEPRAASSSASSDHTQRDRASSAPSTRPQTRSPSPINQAQLYAEGAPMQTRPPRQNQVYAPQPLISHHHSRSHSRQRSRHEEETHTPNASQIQSDHELAMRLQAEEHARYQAEMHGLQSRSPQPVLRAEPESNYPAIRNQQMYPQIRQSPHYQHQHQHQHQQQQLTALQSDHHHQLHHHHHSHHHHYHSRHNSTGHSLVNLQSPQLANATHIAVREYPPQGSNEPVRQHLIPLPRDPAMRQRVLVHLLEQVARNQQGSQGASQQIIQALPTFQVTEGSMAEGGQCNICLEDYAKGDEIKILPCAHMFHTSCTDAWIVRNKTCPVCKHDVNKYE